MKKSFLVGIVTGAVSLVGAVVLKNRAGCCSKISSCCGKKKIVMKYLDWKLHLTQSQKDKIGSIVDGLMASHDQKKESKRAVMNQFSELFLSDQFDSESIQKQVVEQLVIPCTNGAGSALEQIHAILSPEQRREVVRLVEKHCPCFKDECCNSKGMC